MTGLLTLLNTLVPSLLALYKQARSEAKALDANVVAFDDADLIRLLLEESNQTVSKAEEILARLNATPPTS